MDTQLILALKNNKLLKNIDLSKINLEQIKGDLLTVHEGEIIYREGNPSEEVFLVVSGEINLLKKKLLGKTKSLVFYDNDFFGYEEYLEGTSRTSTTVALRDSYIIKLSRTEIENLCEQENGILENLKDPSLTEDITFEQNTVPEIKIEEEPEETKDEITPEEFNISEEDFKVPDELQSTIDSAIEGMDDDFINEIENELESKLNNAGDENAEENVEENLEEKFSLDEQAFAESLKEKDLSAGADDDVVFSIDELDSIDETEETKINEEPVQQQEGLSAGTEEPKEEIENIEEIKEEEETEEPEEFSAQPYQAAGSYQKPELEEPAEEEIPGELNTENNFDFEKNYASDLSKEDEEFFANLTRGENENFEIPSTGETRKDFPITLNEDSNLPETGEQKEEEKTEDENIAKSSIPDFEDFPPGLLDDDGIPKPEGEIPDDFNFDHETVEPIEPQANENMFEVEEPGTGEAKNIDEVFPEESIDENLDDDTEKVTYKFNDDSIDILEGDLNDDLNLDEQLNSDIESAENFDEKFLSDEELEADENLKNIKTVNKEEIIEEENIKASSTEDGHMTADQLMMINKAAQLVNSNIKLDEVLSNIVDVATNLTNADRGTLYLVDKEKGELWSKVAMGNELKQIRLNIGEGIAGWVAQSGEIVNIEDVKSDSRFKADYDKSSGYQTKTMLCYPIKNKEEEIVGVVQLLNSKNGKFSALDETFLDALSIHAALALENASLVEKLLQTERVSSLGKMANFLIQDIKKPVLVSKRYAEHLRSKEFPQDIYQVIDMLMEQLNHVADIVQTTSSYSQGTSLLRTTNTSLNQLLDDYSGRIESLVTTRNCSIMKEYGDDVKVKVDIKEFNQCYSHIVKNACDAMPEGGTIKISTRKEGNNIKISFKDFGLGIPDTMKEKIFEPFMSHGKKEGTGLGLSITKKLVEDHGGTIEVYSELGEGADFIITLPIASAF